MDIAFDAPNVSYGPEPMLDPYSMNAMFGRPLRDERTTSVAVAAPRAGDVLDWTYDLGDNWEHRVVVERVLAADADRPGPVCTAGSGLPPGSCRPAHLISCCAQIAQPAPF